MKYVRLLAPLVTLLTIAAGCDDDSPELAGDAAVSDASLPEPHADAGVPLADAAVVDASSVDASDDARDAHVPVDDGSVEPPTVWTLTFPGEYEPDLVVLGDELWSVSRAHDAWEVTVRRSVAGSVEQEWPMHGVAPRITTDGQAVFVLMTIADVTEVLGEPLGEEGKQALVVLRMERDGTVAWRHVFLGDPDVQSLGFAADSLGNVVFGYVSGDISVSHTDEWEHGLVELDALSGEVVGADALVDLKGMVMRSDGTPIIYGMLLPGEHYGEHENETTEIETFVASLPRALPSRPFAVFWQSHRSSVSGLHEDDPIIGSSDDDIWSLTRLSGVDGSLLWTHVHPGPHGLAYYNIIPGLQGDLKILGHYEHELNLSDTVRLPAPGVGGDFFVASLDGATGEPESAMAMPGEGQGFPGTVVSVPGEACPLASGSYDRTLTFGGVELPQTFELTGFIVSLCSTF